MHVLSIFFKIILEGLGDFDTGDVACWKRVASVALSLNLRALPLANNILAARCPVPGLWKEEDTGRDNGTYIHVTSVCIRCFSSFLFRLNDDYQMLYFRDDIYTCVFFSG